MAVAMQLLLVTSSFASVADCGSRFRMYVPSLPGGATFGVSTLHWELDAPYFDYALLYSTCRDIDPQDINIKWWQNNSPYRFVSPDSRWGYRFNAGVVIPHTGNDLIVAITHYNNNTTSLTARRLLNDRVIPTLSSQWPTFNQLTITDPALANAVTLFIPAVTNPDGMLRPAPSFPSCAKAWTNVNQNAVDLELGQWLNFGRCTRLRFFGGARYGSVKNQFEVLYSLRAVAPNSFILTGAVPDTSITANLTADINETLSQKSRFGGFGPRFGVDFSHHLGYGFAFVGAVSYSLLVGTTHSSFKEIFTRRTSAEVLKSTIIELPVATVFSQQEQTGYSIVHPGEKRIVPNMDGKIGLGYSYQYRNKSHTKFTVEFGYQMSRYYDAIIRFSETTSRQLDVYQPRVVNADFHGLYASLQITDGVNIHN